MTRFPSSRGRYLAMTASTRGLYLRDDPLGAFLDLVVEERRDAAERLGDLGRAEEVVLDPGDAVLLLHVPRDVVHRAVAVERLSLDLRRVLELGEGAVAGPLRDHAQAHLLEQGARRPGVAADVVVADDGHVVGRRFPVPADSRAVRRRHGRGSSRWRCGGRATARRPRNPSQRTGTTVLPISLFFFFETASMSSPMSPMGHSDWTEMPLSEREQPFDLVDDLGELLVAAEDDVLLLEVGGELHRDERVRRRSCRYSSCGGRTASTGRSRPGRGEMWIMSLIGPHTTPFEPA